MIEIEPFRLLGIAVASGFVGAEIGLLLRRWSERQDGDEIHGN